jgi:hypothetical protein
MFQGTGLTEASQRGAVYVGADTVGERISGAVRSATESRSITYLYEGELDATGHRRGCGVVGLEAPAGHDRQLRGSVA